MLGDNLYLNIYYLIRILMLIAAVFLSAHVAKVMFSCSVYVLRDAIQIFKYCNIKLYIFGCNCNTPMISDVTTYIISILYLKNMYPALLAFMHDHQAVFDINLCCCFSPFYCTR